MNKLSFWHKVAFLANVCWLATWGIKYYSILPNGDLQSTVLVTGLIMANIINLLTNLATAISFLRGKLSGAVPRWLLIANFLFLLPQFYLFFK